MALGVGANTTLVATEAVAIGVNASAKNRQAIAIGAQALSTGRYSTAVGGGGNAAAQVLNDYATAYGNGAQANGFGASAIGGGDDDNVNYTTFANGRFSLGMVGGMADGDRSLAIGKGSSVAVADGVALGSGSTSDRALGPSLGLNALWLRHR